MQLTSREAARLLGVDEPALEKWVRDGELAATRVNDQYRLNRIDLLEFASARGLEISPELLAELEHPTLPTLAHALRAGGVHRDLSGEGKAEILRAVVDRLALPSQVDKEQLHRVLLAREALGSTALGDGIAIPHPRNPIVLRIPRPLVAICYLDSPVDFEAADGKPVHTLVTLVTPSTRAHLHLLARVAAALRDRGVHDALVRRAPLEALLPEIERVEAALAARRAGGNGGEGTSR
jgi:PTS system nitrogen regulatory IIA component